MGKDPLKAVQCSEQNCRKSRKGRGAFAKEMSILGRSLTLTLERLRSFLAGSVLEEAKDVAHTC